MWTMITVSGKISASVGSNQCGKFCFTEKKFQNRPLSLLGNEKEAIHPTVVWQTEKSKLNFIIRTVLFLVCIFLSSTFTGSRSILMHSLYESITVLPSI